MFGFQSDEPCFFSVLSSRNKKTKKNHSKHKNATISRQACMCRTSQVQI